jgi:hypothetical protein
MIVMVAWAGTVFARRSTRNLTPLPLLVRGRTQKRLKRHKNWPAGWWESRSQFLPWCIGYVPKILHPNVNWDININININVNKAVATKSSKKTAVIRPALRFWCYEYGWYNQYGPRDTIRTQNDLVLRTIAGRISPPQTYLYHPAYTLLTGTFSYQILRILYFSFLRTALLTCTCISCDNHPAQPKYRLLNHFFLWFLPQITFLTHPSELVYPGIPCTADYRQ